MRKQIICPKCGCEYWSLRPSEKKVVTLLNNRKDVHFKELQEKTELSAPGLTDALAFLVEKDFIKKDYKKKHYNIANPSLFFV